MRVVRHRDNHEGLLRHIKVIKLYPREGVKETRVRGGGRRERPAKKISKGLKHPNSHSLISILE